MEITMIEAVTLTDKIYSCLAKHYKLNLCVKLVLEFKKSI